MSWFKSLLTNENTPIMTKKEKTHEVNEVVNTIMEKKIDVDIDAWGSNNITNEKNKNVVDIFSDEFNESIIDQISKVSQKYYDNQLIPLLPIKDPRNYPIYIDDSVDSIQSIIMNEVSRAIHEHNIPIVKYNISLETPISHIKESLSSIFHKNIDQQKNASELKITESVMREIKQYITKKTTDKISTPDNAWIISYKIISFRSNVNSSIEININNPQSATLLYNPSSNIDAKKINHIITKNMGIEMEKKEAIIMPMKRMIVSSYTNDLYDIKLKKTDKSITRNDLWSIFIAGSTIEHIELALVFKTTRDFVFVKYNLQSLIIIETITISPNISDDIRRYLFDVRRTIGKCEKNIDCYKISISIWRSIIDIIKENIDTINLDDIELILKRFDQTNWNFNDNTIIDLKMEIRYRKFPSKKILSKSEDKK